MMVSVNHDTINIGGGYEPDEMIMDDVTGSHLRSKGLKTKHLSGINLTGVVLHPAYTWPLIVS